MCAGKDSTGSFEDVGHSPDAREMAESYRIGTVSQPASSKVPVSEANALTCSHTCVHTDQADPRHTGRRGRVVVLACLHSHTTSSSGFLFLQKLCQLDS